jgi:hypothetical protein
MATKQKISMQQSTKMSGIDWGGMRYEEQLVESMGRAQVDHFGVIELWHSKKQK